MKAWLTNVLAHGRPLPEEIEFYLLGRGVREETIEELNIGVWREPDTKSPDPAFANKYGATGDQIAGWIIYPFFSPHGDLLGVDARTAITGKRKTVVRYLLPEAEWNPIFVGTPQAASKLWEGGVAWLVEGIFDKTALEHVVPSCDAVLAAVRAGLTTKQIEFLKRYARNGVNVAFDNDPTGRDGTQRAVALLNKAQVPHVRAYAYRGGKDPGEIWEISGTLGLRVAMGL